MRDFACASNLARQCPGPDSPGQYEASGYISLNLITARDHVDADKPAVQKLLANLDFQDGKHCTDFNEKTDKVAEYGLAALVGGIAAKKLGLFAVIAAFFAKFAKVAILAVAGFGATIAKLFKRKSST